MTCLHRLSIFTFCNYVPYRHPQLNLPLILYFRHLLKWGADVHARNNFRDTPCHLAAYRGRPETVQQLLAAGSDPRVKNSRGNSVRDEAKAGSLCLGSGNQLQVQYLLDVYLRHGSVNNRLGSVIVDRVE